MYKPYHINNTDNPSTNTSASLRDNEEAFNRYKIKPRILVNVDKIDMSSEIFGHTVSMPLGFSPAAMHRLAHPEGEIAVSKAAANFNVCMALSSYATESIENVTAQGTGNPYVMQLCVLRDRQTTTQLLRRAEATGCKAVFISVDVPMLGRRLNEHRNNFVLPDGLGWPNLLSDGKSELSGVADEGAQAYEFGMPTSHLSNDESANSPKQTPP